MRALYRTVGLSLLGVWSMLGPADAARQRSIRPLPIVDVHLHASERKVPWAICIPWIKQVPAIAPGRTWQDAWTAVTTDPPCANPIRPPADARGVMDQTLAIVNRRNIIGVLSGRPEAVRRWREAAPDRFIPAVEFRADSPDVSPASIRRLFSNGDFVVLGEVLNQYFGMAADDEKMAPYWALAEELDIPVAIHLGEGLPGATFTVRPAYRARLSSPFALEEVLNRHPRLRIYVMHYSSPLVEEMIAMLGAYPQLYVDLGGMQWYYPRAYFYQQLRKFIDAGFGTRVMFGSDQGDWPDVIEPAIVIVEEAPFLIAEQRRDIFYNNAARFLRFSEADIARHHGR